MRIRLEKRMRDSKLALLTVPIISVVLALIFGAVFLALTGKDPMEVYKTMYTGAFGSAYGLSETVVKAIPLALCALGISLAFRMQLWNIGAEGQFYMGTFGATWVALTFPNGPWYLVLPGMFIAGFICGALWGLLPALPRAFYKVNETITTLMLNYVAILWVDYLVYGPWRDPKGFNFPLTAMFSESATLPALGTTRIHMGLFFALGAAVIIFLIMRYSKWGFEIRVLGESEGAGKYAGMNITRNILLVMFVSGGLAGIAGMAEVSGITQRLQHGISPGYGYSAIIIAWLARLNPWATLGVSFLLGGMMVGGYTIQSSGIPAATVYMLQGAILFFVLGGEIFTRYRIVIKGKEPLEIKGRVGKEFGLNSNN